ncbi:MAG TPA: hypothetical protein VF969_08720, partial [Burkholderiales bacterium]
LARRAAEIAARALDAVPATARRTSEVLSALDASARLDGAEEVLTRLASDLRADSTLRRFEGEAPLGERYGVELSVAYKAAWVRVTRCFSRNAAPRSWELAARWFAETASRLDEKSVSAGLGALPPPGKLASWIVETCTGSQPLSIFAGDRLTPRQALPAGALASLSLRLSLDDGPWLGGGPLVIGASGRPSRLLI